MHPLQQEKLNKLQSEITELEAQQKQLVTALADAIRTGDSFTTIFGLAIDYRMNGYSLGFAQAETVNTKFPITYPDEN